MKFKVIIASLLFWIVCFFAWYIYVYSTKVKWIYHFSESTKKEVNLIKEKSEWTVYIEDWISFTWNIKLHKWTIVIGKRVKFTWNISLDTWTIVVWDFSMIKWDITTKVVNLSLWKKVKILWNISKNTELSRYSSSLITWTKPHFYKTIDRPDALVYFDILPEAHRSKLWYVFLIKNAIFDGVDTKNIKPEEYYDGIYYYKDKKLQQVDLKKDWAKFLKASKEFLNSIPEHRRAVYNVWWATRKKAVNKSSYWDIYLPSKGSSITFIHEMAHVVDFKWNYSDFYNPKYPYSSKSTSVTDYWATHPGEDFAESYRLYVSSPTYYKSLFKNNPEAKKKYNYMKKYVFSWYEY